MKYENEGEKIFLIFLKYNFLNVYATELIRIIAILLFHFYSCNFIYSSGHKVVSSHWQKRMTLYLAQKVYTISPGCLSV